MSKNANTTAIGAFTLIGIIIAVAALVVTGAGKFFDQTREIIIYFDKSATGLQVGSDVRFGGVRIGQVKSIQVLIDASQNRKIIPVVVSLNDKDLANIRVAGAGNGLDLRTIEGVEKAVESGLRARMMQQSLLTGQLYIEFDMVPDLPGFFYDPVIDPDLPVVPTVATEIDELIAGVADGLKKLAELDIEGVLEETKKLITSASARVNDLRADEIGDNLVEISANIRKLTGDQAISRAIDDFEETLAQTREMAAKMNRSLDPLLEDLAEVVKSTNASLARIEEATGDITEATDPRAPSLLRLQSVLDDAERSTRSLQELTDSLKRSPSSLLRGKPNDNN